MSPLWRLEFYVGSKIFGKLLHACVISGFHRDVDAIYVLLGRYAA
jgi:hypothetical protein